MVRITQYREKCIGCHVCVEVAYNRWRMSKKDGKSTLLRATEKKGIYTVVVGDDEWEENQLAAQHCPARIIQVQKI